MKKSVNLVKTIIHAVSRSKNLYFNLEKFLSKCFFWQKIANEKKDTESGIRDTSSNYFTYTTYTTYTHYFTHSQVTKVSQYPKITTFYSKFKIKRKTHMYFSCFDFFTILVKKKIYTIHKL